MISNSAIFAIFLHMTSIIASKQKCTFVPNPNLDCVQYMKFFGNVGCIRLKDSLVVTDIYKSKDGKVWIGVQLEGGRAIYVQRNHGLCLDDCCETLQKSSRKTRFLLTDAIKLLSPLFKNNCDPDPCNHGDCHDGLTGFLCTCYRGYTGKLCNTEIDYCSHNQCHGHGKCHNEHYGFECTCDVGFTGRTCQTAIPNYNLYSTTTTTQLTSTPTLSTIPTTPASQTQTTGPCIDNSFVNCTADDVCSTNLKQFCPLSCRLCTPMTTPTPCFNDHRVQCSDMQICSSALKSFCPVTCNLCGKSSLVGLNHIPEKTTTVLDHVLQSSATMHMTTIPTGWINIMATPTTSWLPVNGK